LTAKSTAALIFMTVVGLVSGYLVGSRMQTASAPEAGPEATGPWAELPVRFLANRPLVDDVRGDDYRLAVVRYGGPVKLLRRHCLQGNFDLTVFDRGGRPVYSMTNGEAYSDCRADYSDFVSDGRLRLVWYDWDVRVPNPVPWKVEVVIFKVGRPPEAGARVAIDAEKGDAVRVAKLVADARRGFDICRKAPSDSEDSRRGYELMERSLNHLRNVGVGRPDEVLAALRGMTWADGAAAEQIGRYVEQIEDVKRIRSGK
jgi:hypothetical protein